MPSNAEGAEVKTTDDPKTMIKTWRPAAFLHADPANPPPPYAVIILNQPIDNPGLFVQICKNGNTH